MKTYRLLSIACLFGLFVMSSCSSNKTAIGSSEPTNDAQQNVDLTDRLKGYPGIRVYGNRSAAKIYARGVGSISNNVPLFILNGNQVPDYPTLYSMVTTRSIKRVEVLVKPEDTGIYGHRGANGVIKVTTVEEKE